jgi:hypothetical protein
VLARAQEICDIQSLELLRDPRVLIVASNALETRGDTPLEGLVVF